ncbi:hypothetical protein HaLaN_24103 [Haematococcus lacustris]|uniref:Uncharacterized protein n=1 Tax=Haematococcus lacustris TaxID=44745 RepID=A0A699ZXY5_HAELA|nr:hypothetical protein HaLaN_24103 [Haematococcus lacustris]
MGTKVAATVRSLGPRSSSSRSWRRTWRRCPWSAMGMPSSWLCSLALLALTLGEGGVLMRCCGPAARWCAGPGAQASGGAG